MAEAGLRTLFTNALTEFSTSSKILSVVPLTGDASTRSYFRLNLEGFSKGTMILMKLNQIDRGIVSEEIVEVSRQFNELPFLNIQGFLHKIGARVPEIYYYSEKDGLLFLEDFGDSLMVNVVSKMNPDEILGVYRQAIKQLLHMQYEGIKNRDENCYAFWHSFDEKLFMWEFNHFIEYAIEKRLGAMKKAHRKICSRYFKIISSILSKEPRVFTHRDYHSRNLMVMDDSLGILDFQDALLGPAQYDLASLLRDSYFELDELLVNELVDFYLVMLAEEHNISQSKEEFRDIFDLASIQRNLKAAGRFHYINQVKKNPNYLQYVPGTLRRVGMNLKKYPWLNELHSVLAEYLRELNY